MGTGGKRLSLCFTASLSHPPPPPLPTLSPSSRLYTQHLHLGQHYYSQLTACYPILHITLDRDSLRPAFLINLTTLQSSTTPRHALCTPFHKPALTASVRIDLVTSTGPHRQQQRERLPPTHHTDTQRKKESKAFLTRSSTWQHQTSNISQKPTQQKRELLWTHP